MNVPTSLALVLILACTAAYGEDNSTSTAGENAIMCYECSSHPDHEGSVCDDPIDPEELKKYKKSCGSGICYKYNQVVQKDIEQINRGCAMNLEPLLIEKKDDEGCVLSTGTKMIQVQICNCKSADCNGGSEVKSAISTIMAAGLLCLLAQLLP